LFPDFRILQILEPTFEPQSDVDANDDHEDLEDQVGPATVVG
jgi:hypothetical protein